MSTSDTSQTNALLERGESLFERLDAYRRVTTEELSLLADDLTRIERVEPEDADRLRTLLKDVVEAGFHVDADELNDRVPARDSYRGHLLHGYLCWRQRDHQSAIRGFRQALQSVPDDPDERARTLRALARVAYESGDHDQAREVLVKARAVDDAPFDIRFAIRVTSHSLDPGEFPTDREFLAEILGQKRSHFRARIRISTLYNAVECARGIGASADALALARDAFDIARATGIPLLQFSTGLATGHALRTVGRLEEAIETLDALPRFRFGGFDSEQRLSSERALYLMHLGRFEEAQASFATSLGVATRLGEERSAANVLAIRGAIWVFEQEFDAAWAALDEAYGENPTTLTAVIRSIVAAIDGDRELARDMSEAVTDAWSDSNSFAGRSVALSLRAVIAGDRELLDEARRAAVVADAPFVALVEACEWILGSQEQPPAWMEEWQGGGAPPLFGSVAGVAVAGWTRMLVQSEPPAVAVIEPGLYRVQGETIDLRRRDSLRRIVDAMRENPGTRYDVVDLFDVGWDADTIPTTYSDRVYFAMYELRRLGFREFIEKSDEGYYWSPESSDDS